MGALPTISVPSKSHDRPISNERHHLDIVKESPPQVTQKYQNLNEVYNRTKNLKYLENNKWKLKSSDNKIVFTKMQVAFTLPKNELIGDESLGFSVIVFGWVLPEEHEIYKMFLRSIRNISIIELLDKIRKYELCEGLKVEAEGSLTHCVPQEMNLENKETYQRQTKVLKRSPNYVILTHLNTICKNCVNLDKETVNKKMKISSKSNIAAHKNALLSKTSHQRISLALKQERMKCNQLEKEILKMRREVHYNSVKVDPTISNDIKEIMSNNLDSASPFMKLFWQQQHQAFSSQSKYLQYHPMIIRFCLSLAVKSAAAYDELRNSKVLTLPSR